MKETNTEEKFFRELLSKSKLVVPITDFDDNVMRLIEKRLSKKGAVARDLKLSWIFFIIGSTFGLIVSIVLPKFLVSEGITFEKFSISLLLVFSFLIVTQLENLINFYKRKI